jgi:dihydropteroate synthase
MKDTKFMGVLNVTPDSFSDGGRFEVGGEDLAEVVRQMASDGAAILDIGGESTGPGSHDVSLEEELKRVVPAVAIAARVLREMGSVADGVLISVDTWKSEVAEAAIAAGAGMINDVTGGRGDERIFDVAARTGVPIVLMYSKDASPRTTREEPDYEDVMKTISEFLMGRVEVARERGVRDEQIILDPGMGAFLSGDPDVSYEVIERIEELSALGFPVLVGTSRKSFLGEDRFGGTLMTTISLRGRVDYLRVHDVYENVTAFELV